MFANTPSEFGGPAIAPLPAPSGQQNIPGQTPQQAYDAQNNHQLPPNTQSPNTQPTQQRLETSIARLQYIKSECLGAANPYLLRDRLVWVIEVLEYVLAGQVSKEISNQVPGNRPQEDHTRAKVQFLGVTQSNDGNTPFATPMAPITNGDVKFTPAPNGGFSVEGGAGQAVQFYDGPAGTPYAGGDNSNGQKVEFFAGPTAPPAPAPPPQAQNPVSNSPAATFTPTAPTLSTEAGGNVPPMAPSVPTASPFADAIAPQVRPAAMAIPTH